ncbi:MAG: spermidine synthase [Syntrophobacteria bacterium]
MNESFWFQEQSRNNVVIQYRCVGRVYEGHSRFAKIDIVDTLEYGRMLFLDGICQSAQQDEFVYHESLVHPAMLTHPSARCVCVIGGAEGATIREVCKYPQVERIVMVDIDEELVTICKQYLEAWSDSAYEDPRLELHFTDGRRYLEQTGDTFDVIIVDLSDPIEESPAIFLFTHEFYKVVYRRLTSHGVACFQGESLDPNHLGLHATMVKTLSLVFRRVVPYPYFISSFHELYAHILASKQLDPRPLELANRLDAQDINLRYLTPSLLRNSFSMPGYVEQAYSQYREPLTDTRPMLYQT